MKKHTQCPLVHTVHALTKSEQATYDILRGAKRGKTCADGITSSVTRTCCCDNKKDSKTYHN